MGSQSASLTISNNTSGQSRDYLTFHTTLNGVPHLIWLPVVLPPGTHVDLSAVYLQPIDPPVIILCGDKPVGGVDDPQPLVGITQTPPQQ